MKTALTLLLAFTCLTCSAQWMRDPGALAGMVGKPATAITYLINENMEGTGIPSNWNVAGTVDWDYTGVTIGSPSQCLKFTSAGAATVYIPIGSQSGTVYVKLKAYITAWPSTSQTLFGVRDNSAAALTLFRVDTSGHVGCYANGADSTFTVSVLQKNTAYYCWLKFVSGGTSTASFFATDAQPTSGDNFASRTAGVVTATRFYGSSASMVADVILLDDIQISLSPIP